MSIAHGAPFASGALPIFASEGIGEGITSTGEPIERSGEGIGLHREPIADTLARISERLAVVAVSAHIMERRAPRDVYARSIARETHALAVELRETIRQAHAGAPMRAPRIVDAASSTDTAPATEDADGEHIGELCPFPGCCHFYNDPCADCLEVERGADRGATSRGSPRRSTARKPRQTPPEARQRATQAQTSERGERAAHSHASLNASLGVSDGASGVKGGAQ